MSASWKNFRESICSSSSSLSDLDVRARIFFGIPPGSAGPTPDILQKRAEKKQDFSLFFRRRRNFSSLSVMATTLANRDLSIEWAFDFKSNRLLGDERISEGAQDSLKQ